MQNFNVFNTISPIIIITIYNFYYDNISMTRLVSTAGLHKKGQLFEKDIEFVLSGVENTKECMTHSPLELRPIRGGVDGRCSNFSMICTWGCR